MKDLISFLLALGAIYMAIEGKYEAAALWVIASILNGKRGK